MSGNETRTLWISIGLALFAMFLFYSWSEEKKSELAKRFGSTKRAVVAASDISEMETIDESKLTLADLPADFMQPDVVTDIETAVGQVAAAPIKKNEQVLATKLLLPGPDTGLSMEVSPGKRAVSLPVDDVRGVARLIKPGDRIDLIAAVDYGRGGDNRREVRTILQDVPVLATGVNIVNKLPRRFEIDGKVLNRINLSGSTNFSTITIEAKPEDAQILLYMVATDPGKLFVSLRNPSDRIQEPMRTTVVEDVLQKANLLRAPTSQQMDASGNPFPIIRGGQQPAGGRGR